MLNLWLRLKLSLVIFVWIKALRTMFQSITKGLMQASCSSEHPSRKTIQHKLPILVQPNQAQHRLRSRIQSQKNHLHHRKCLQKLRSHYRSPRLKRCPRNLLRGHSHRRLWRWIQGANKWKVMLNWREFPQRICLRLITSQKKTSKT